MVTLQEHKQKWLHSREFLKTIGDAYSDWMVTVMFYTALHAVETLFCFDKLEPQTSHTARNSTLKSINRYKAIWQNYRPLYDAARSTRYDADAPAWIEAQDAKGEFVRNLYAIEKSVLKLIGGTATKLDKIW